MSAVNYDAVMGQLRDAGLVVEHLEVGRLRRCKVEGDREKRGWYSLHEIVLDGGDLAIVGSFGIWHGLDNGAQRVALRKLEVSDAQREALRARIRDDQRRALAARKREAERAARRATRVWAQCATTGASDYLARKGVGAHGVRFTATGSLVVPMCDGRAHVHGLQFILSRDAHKARIARTGRDKEYWPAGLAKQGHYHLIGGTPGRLVLIAEGYATAASLHEATGLTVAVAFDAGNLPPVSEGLHKRYPRARQLLCADDDWLGRCPACAKLTPSEPAPGAAATCQHCGADTARLANTGKTAARAAALAVDGQVLWPVFAARGPTDKFTDWNDLHQREGLHVVRAQVEAHLAAVGWSGLGEPAAGANGDGGAGARGEWAFNLDALLRDYSLVYSTETVFDAARGMVVGLGPLRAAAGRATVSGWLEHPDRRVVLPDQVGFDPTEREGLTCNLWTGWPAKPRRGSCELLLDLLGYLCGNEDDPDGLVDWVLNWLAYPIQNPGAKMQTALLIHGPEGTGKNTLFSAIAKIYGRYATSISQTELESQFNGWASGKLFVVGNEVVQRAELYHQKGRLKNMITERSWIINEKQLPARSESNHANFVFFSNRLDIANLDRNDRRYCVIWTPEPRADRYYQDVADEIADGGAEALHDVLLTRPLGNFDAHAKPPLTRSKRELIELSFDSTERFWRQWVAQDLDVPCMPCRADHLYDAYKTWCTRAGIPRYAPSHILMANLSKQPGVVRSIERYRIGMRTDRRRMLFPPGQHLPPGGVARATWLSQCVEKFHAALDDYRNGRDVTRDEEQAA